MGEYILFFTKVETRGKYTNLRGNRREIDKFKGR